MDGLAHFVSELGWWLSITGLVNTLILFCCFQLLDKTKQIFQRYLLVPLYLISGYFIASVCLGINLSLLHNNLLILNSCVASVSFLTTYWIAFSSLKDFISFNNLAQNYRVNPPYRLVTQKVIHHESILSNEEIYFLQHVMR